MIEFASDSEHVAHSVLSNPKGMAIAYNGELYLGSDGAAYASSGLIPFTIPANNSLTVDFPITMPAAGVYQVSLFVTSAGLLIATYVATEGITVIGAWEGGTWRFLPIEKIWDLEDHEPNNPIIQNTAQIDNLRLVPITYEYPTPPWIKEGTIVSYQFLIPDWKLWTPASWVISLGFDFQTTVGYWGYSDGYGNYFCDLEFAFVLVRSEDVDAIRAGARPAEVTNWWAAYQSRLGESPINTGTRTDWIGLGERRIGSTAFGSYEYWLRVPLGDYVLLAVAESDNPVPRGDGWYLRERHVYTLMEITVSQDPPEVPEYT